ncbi:MAG: metallophosphoesterase, partial [bacterium]|nr:metallophosphoesterase [bacterium]
ITTTQLQPAELADNYSFAVVSNRYDKDSLPASTFFAKLSQLQTAPLDFLVVTGDISNTHDKGGVQTVNTLFANNTPYPVLYNPGNFDLLPQKPYEIASERFYTDQEYFLLLSLGSDSVASNEQRLFAFNALLELEQLPDIKNLFIIAHDLNWQDRSNPNNFIHQLEKQLANFPGLNIHILTADHGGAGDAVTLQNGNTSYYANAIPTEDDSEYTVINVNPSSNVTFSIFDLD